MHTLHVNAWHYIFSSLDAPATRVFHTCHGEVVADLHRMYLHYNKSCLSISFLPKSGFFLWNCMDQHFLDVE